MWLKAHPKPSKTFLSFKNVPSCVQRRGVNFNLEDSSLFLQPKRKRKHLRNLLHYYSVADFQCEQDGAVRRERGTQTAKCVKISNKREQMLKWEGGRQSIQNLKSKLLTASILLPSLCATVSVWEPCNGNRFWLLVSMMSSCWSLPKSWRFEGKWADKWRAHTEGARLTTTAALPCKKQMLEQGQQLLFLCK